MRQINTLKKLTNGLPYNNDKIERGQFDKRNKVKMFANWLDNTNLTDIGVNINELTKSNLTNKNWRMEFGKKVGVTYPLALDPGADIFAKYADRNAGITRNVLIDKEGKIVMLTRLFNEDEFAALCKKIDEMLAE